MKIQPVQSYDSSKNANTNGLLKMNYLNSPKTNLLNGNNSYSPNFGVGARGALKEARSESLNILGRNHSAMVDMAESLHKCSDRIIKSVSTVYKSSLVIFRDEDVSKSRKAYEKLSTAVKEVVTKKSSLEREAAKRTPGSRRSDEIRSEIRRLDDKAKRARDEYELWLED